MTFAVTVGGNSVECGEDQALLDACLRAGVWMPNSCNQGTCGTCKLHVVAGEVDHGSSPVETLSDEERCAGMALACQARPRGDVELRPQGTSAARTANPLRDMVGTVREVSDIARDTRRILLGLNEPLTFDAGQYVELVVPGSGERRQYSLANTADEDKVLELHVKLVPDGVATHGWLFDGLAEGDEVDISGPLGDFHLPPESEDDGGPMVLIGGGTGLAPLIGIVRTALRRHPAREVVLYHGVRGEEELYDGDRLTELAEQHPNFRFVPVLSHEPADGYREGFPTDAFVEDVSTARGWTGWLCGPPAMVEAGVKAFKRRRMAPRNIHREKFTPADA
ncbi:CDP-4-dehydro-6-deoxyglucose reductase/3-phenylpropionate/trans-cinnamate dioxygenase ferredoxin reductase subunit/phenol hydroxylase P5 protein [Prauserella isguenensis]|uniref:CDP-4-dehydro-6-deoxyglucose reductase/3-phenylpropionate/trans-cinnamate dioxygenase ferredoxin reductase subunit/phenol hydroxylase P5 protein n=1 Tax=Prauserella isguenensis TaxID=1470180 RepID=A0A839RYB5_9PSEU|nr:2Fe-2S iron-sulfur cluster-binding protein [Prauserella isguenensis]MBB3050608.1 CDP-4-dehydro-6-deoxyglucose reductase/3-phenylpropionate/trans-cinnamate dioxygenase ferredoxin reductase subunit/phenol hydroxylase P5 protein [Prauserella isguenensis]